MMELDDEILVDPNEHKSDDADELTIRPKRLEEYIG